MKRAGKYYPQKQEKKINQPKPTQKMLELADIELVIITEFYMLKKLDKRINMLR